MFADNEAPRVRVQIKQCATQSLIILPLTPAPDAGARAALVPQQAVPGSDAHAARLRAPAARGQQGASRRPRAPCRGAVGQPQLSALTRSLAHCCLCRQVKATLYLKHRQALGEHTNLNAKVELHARTALEGGKLSEVEKRVDGRVELSQKLLNLTGPSPVSCFTSTLLTRPRLPAADSQDCRLRLGVDLRAQSVYAEARAIVFMSALPARAHGSLGPLRPYLTGTREPLVAQVCAGPCGSVLLLGAV